MIIPNWVDGLKATYNSDEFLKHKMKQWQLGQLDTHLYSYKDGLLYFKGKIFLHSGHSYVPNILQTYHLSPIGGQCKISQNFGKAFIGYT